MKHFFFFSLMLLLPFCLLADIVEIQGNVSGVYTADTILVTDNVTVPAGSTFEVAAGTKVLFDGFYYIRVDGCMKAIGDSDTPVVFTPTDTLGFADTLEMRGAWHGLRFIGNSTGPASVFVHCRFQYAKALDADSLLGYGGVVHANGQSAAVFEHCVFAHNRAWHRGGAVALLNGAGFVFRNCEFRENMTYNPNAGYGGALFAENADPVIDQCSFISNLAVWTGGGACFYYSNPLIHNNIFTGNYGYIGGGMAFYNCRPQRTICNNLVYGNTGLYFGGGISCNNACDPVFVNNTICHNQATYGGGFYCNDSAAPTIYNTLIYHNINFSGLGPVYIWDPLSHPNFHYCNIQGGMSAFAGSGGGAGYWGNYTDNYDEIPEFNPNSPYLYFPAGSSLIDRGTPAADTTGLNLPQTDLAGSPRVYNGRVDVGAYEWWNVGIPSNTLPLLRVSAAAATDRASMVLTTDAPAGRYLLRLIDMQGRVLMQKYIMTEPQGGDIHLQCQPLRSSRYVLTLAGNGKAGSCSFVVQ